MSIAQIALAWVLTRPGVGGAIVGGTSAKHIDRTLHAAQALAPALTAEQQSRLSEASSGAGGAIAAGDCYTIERDPSTPSGAALAPWTNVGTLAKPPHWEELKRRTLETLRLLVRPPRLSAPQFSQHDNHGLLVAHRIRARRRCSRCPTPSRRLDCLPPWVWPASRVWPALLRHGSACCRSFGTTLARAVRGAPR